MGIIVDWDNQNKTSIRYQFQGAWDWTDFDNAVQEAFSLSEHMPQRINVIFDLSDGNAIPNGAVIYFKKFMKVVPTNRGQFVIVGMNPQIPAIVTMFNRVFKSVSGRISHADTLERARSYVDYLQVEQNRLAS